ncbi:hypothetical protein FA13DRAFT_1638666, partial [Coprinellus micaceus]
TRRGHKSPRHGQQQRPRSPQASPTKKHKGEYTSLKMSFWPGRGTTATLSACTICLGRHPHKVFQCDAKVLWDGTTPAYCRKVDNGRPQDPNRKVLCSDWQHPSGCNSTTHNTKHECSGCGERDHGAQTCPRAQKA